MFAHVLPKNPLQKNVKKKQTKTLKIQEFKIIYQISMMFLAHF